MSIETGLHEGINKIKTAELSLLLPPPAFPTSKKHQLLLLNVDRTCMDILKKVTGLYTQYNYCAFTKIYDHDVEYLNSYLSP